MKFKEIDNGPGGVLEGCPIEIKVAFHYDFYKDKLLARLQNLKGEEYNAFCLFSDYWEFMEDWEKEKELGEDGNPIDNLTPYYKAFSHGFNEGYFDFENEIKEINLIFEDKETTIKKIFNETISQYSAFSSRGYIDNNKPVLKRKLLFEGGKKAGRNYKAWYYIVHNYKPFIPFFRKSYYTSYKRIDEFFKNQYRDNKGYESPLQTVISEIESDFSLQGQSKQEIQKKEKTISINEEIIDKLISGLKQFFKENEIELRQALIGNKILKKLYYPHNGNQLTDVFYRLHSQGKIKNSKEITANWICENFENKNQKKGRSPFIYTTVYKQLTNQGGGINKQKRICDEV